MSIKVLKKCIKQHGKAKTAVALGLTETAAINNWLARKKIPDYRKKDVKNLELMTDVIPHYNSELS